MKSLSRGMYFLLVPALLAMGGGILAYSLHHRPSPAERSAEKSGGCPLCCKSCDAPTRSQAFFTSLQTKANQKSDSPMFGGSPARNMANTVDSNIPTEFEPKGPTTKWTADLGGKAYGGPTIANGIVFVGTNNDKPRDPAVKGKSKAVIMAFSEADGKFLWQAAHEIPNEPVFMDVRTLGLLSSPAVDSKNVYYITPSGEVVCLEAATGKKVWDYDLRKQLKVHPFHCCNCSPLLVGDKLYLVTGNGADEEGNVPEPKAPSFIAFDKNTGKVAWQSALPGENILEGQWSNPAAIEVNGKTQILFPGGDAVLYSLHPDTGELLWKCNCAPDQKKGDGPISYPISTPVAHDGKVFLGLGVYPDHGNPPRSAYFVCLDATKKGDVSPKSLDAKDAKNAGSALVWAFGGKITPAPKITERQVYFGPTISTAAVHEGLVFISEMSGYLHCLDAKTGQRHWNFDLKGAVWGSPYYVDGKVYLANEDGTVFIFKASKDFAKPTEVEIDDQMQSTPVVANGVLYLTTKSKLFAIAEKK